MSPEARERSFDELARGLASGELSRRKALRLMGAALVGGALGSLGIGAAAADDECKPVNAKCRKNHQCCSGNCSKSGTSRFGTCACQENGGSCANNSQCCSGNCASGTCAAACTSNGGFCFSDDSECCSGNCSNSFCCPAGWMGLSNGTCAMLCTTGSECGAGCTCVSGSSGSFCGTGTGSGRSCLDDDLECPTGEFCVGGQCSAAC